MSFTNVILKAKIDNPVSATVSHNKCSAKYDRVKTISKTTVTTLDCYNYITNP